MFGCRMLFPPRYPILAEGSLVVMAIHGHVQDLQPASVTLGQWKGPFRWAVYQILGMTSKKVRLEQLRSMRNQHMLALGKDRYRWYPQMLSKPKAHAQRSARD